MQRIYWRVDYAFVSGVGGLRFKFLASQIGYIAVNGSPPLQNFFLKSCFYHRVLQSALMRRWAPPTRYTFRFNSPTMIIWLPTKTILLICTMRFSQLTKVSLFSSTNPHSFMIFRHDKAFRMLSWLLSIKICCNAFITLVLTFAKNNHVNVEFTNLI